MGDKELEQLRAELLKAIGEATDAPSLRAKLFGVNGLLPRFVENAGLRIQEAQILQDLAFRRLADLDRQTELERSTFDEFKQRDFTDWKRVRSAIEHENILTNHRLTWLFSSQAFLLTAYTLAFNQWASEKLDRPDFASFYPALLLIIATAGILMCIVVRRSLTGASAQLRRLDNWWHLGPTWDKVTNEFPLDDPTRQRLRERLSFRHPPLQGETRGPLDRFIGSDLIPYYFMFVWFAIVIFTVLRRLPQVRDAVQERGQQALTAAAIAGCVVLGLLLVRKTRELQRHESSKLPQGATPVQTTQQAAEMVAGRRSRLDLSSMGNRTSIFEKEAERALLAEQQEAQQLSDADSRKGSLALPHPEAPMSEKRGL